MHETLEALGRYRILPAAVGFDGPETVLPLCDALIAGGMPVLEITLRAAGGMEAIRLATSERPGVLVGAGTVLTPKQAEQALAAGARYLVSPGLDPDLVRISQNAGIPILPGVATPTEVQTAIKLGLEAVKFFPASILGGAKAIAALNGPFPGMKFVPTGGVNLETLEPYLLMKTILACGGTWMFGRGLITNGNFDAITWAAQTTMDLVTRVTPQNN
ncbi:MAG TPA: bifunctional 4-hydroxy-2-oxoglutarate aldolase/2-dehydro-3-deoxy-phosphogluconate aldolase [Candidatus Hydrogenedentes bacterium]|nr:bifunctional 4-hydroxy-2-oxoglutarate aldolase/2-dehydro-3-deoxy-phosphogluconate aldolase [Candidatus Hydrogenedentota bacterium]